MLYTIQKRHEFGCGTMTTHYEVISYTGISPIGIWLNEKTLKKGTKKECEKYCAKKKLEITEYRLGGRL